MNSYPSASPFARCVLVAVLLSAGCVDGGGRRPAESDTGTDGDARTDSPEGEIDEDGDGVPLPADCDDTMATVYPGAREDCTTPTDEDCDGEGGEADLDCSACGDDDDDKDDDCDEDLDEDTDEDVDEDTDEDVDEDTDVGADAGP